VRPLAGLSAALLAMSLSACGGSVDVVFGYPQADFDIGVLLDGTPLTGVDVFPGDMQTLYVAVGQRFELDSSGPVDWAVVAGGTTIPGSGGIILYRGAALQETLVTSFQFVADVSASAPLPTPVRMTIYATSLFDPNQVAVFDLVIID
jgi:hypothetical protein